MTELLCHLVGDYCLQNQWMATYKSKAWFPAIAHALVYSFPFLLFANASALGWAIILCSHAAIDRYALAKYWMDWYGIGKIGTIWPQIKSWALVELGVAEDEATKTKVSKRVKKELEEAEESSQPEYVMFWLTVIVDNTIHLVINHLALMM